MFTLVSSTVSAVDSLDSESAVFLDKSNKAENLDSSSLLLAENTDF